MVDENYIEPWNCTGCGLYVYNTEFLDGRIVPAPGAPPAHFGSDKHPRLCSMCHDMLDVLINRRYFVDLNTKAVEKVKRLAGNE